jgi:TonB family protein
MVNRRNTRTKASSSILRYTHEQRYGLAASLSIHSIVFIIFFMISLHKGGDDIKTYYIQFTQMGEKGEQTVQKSRPAMVEKKRKAVEKERKVVSEEPPVIRESPVEEQEALIRNDTIENPDSVKVASALGPAPQPQTTDQQDGKSTGSNTSYDDSSGTSGVVETASGADSATAGTSGVVETAFGSTGAPVFLRRQMPVYPMIARKLGKQGKVILRLFINEKGRLLSVEVVEPAGYGFTASAMEAVRMSTFSPAHENGVSVASKALLTIRFVLKQT